MPTRVPARTRAQGKLLQMQRPPEHFSLPLIGMFFWVEAVIVPRSYRLQGLCKLRPAYLDQLRACRSPKLFAQLFGQKPALRTELHPKTQFHSPKMRRALLPPKILFEYCWQAVYPRGPIRSHRRIVAHFSPLPTGEGFSLASTELFRQLVFFILSCKPISYCRFKRIDVYIL